MSTIVWVIVVIAILVVLAAAVVAAISRRPRLRPLSDSARQRYGESWRVIEARFVDDPRQAVVEADQLVVAVYRERGGREDRPPESLREARGMARQGSGDSSTETLRRAMQHYRSTIEGLLRSDSGNSRQRREVAS